MSQYAHTDKGRQTPLMSELYFTRHSPAYLCIPSVWRACSFEYSKNLGAECTQRRPRRFKRRQRSKVETSERVRRSSRLSLTSAGCSLFFTWNRAPTGRSFVSGFVLVENWAERVMPTTTTKGELSPRPVSFATHPHLRLERSDRADPSIPGPSPSSPRSPRISGTTQAGWRVIHSQQYNPVDHLNPTQQN